MGELTDLRELDLHLIDRADGAGVESRSGAHNAGVGREAGDGGERLFQLNAGEGTGGPSRKGKFVVKLRRDSSTCEAERGVSLKPSNGSMVAEAPTTTCSCCVELASS